MNKKNILEDIIARLSKLDTRYHYWMLAGALLFMFLLDYFVLLKPQIDSLSKINPEIQFLSDDFKTAKDNISRVSTYAEELKRLKAQAEELNLKIKSKDDITLVLERISRIANKTHLQINQLTPEIQGQKLVLEKETRQYFLLPIVIEAQGSYHAFGHFLDAVEDDEAFLSVREFVIKATNQMEFQRIKLTLQTIIYDNVSK